MQSSPFAVLVEYLVLELSLRRRLLCNLPNVNSRLRPDMVVRRNNAVTSASSSENLLCQISVLSLFTRHRQKVLQTALSLPHLRPRTLRVAPLVQLAVSSFLFCVSELDYAKQFLTS